MISHDTQQLIKNILRGIIIPEQKNLIATARNKLCKSFSPSDATERNFERFAAIKEEQKQSLIKFIEEKNAWVSDENLKEEFYLTEGGEAKVYFSTDSKSVLKLNDAIYYNTWLDFFHSLLLHNSIFNQTAYDLIGFKLEDDNLFAVLRQPFVLADFKADLNEVKEFLEFNGFENYRQNDYYNSVNHLYLEDIHDENVLASNNTFFFIDTVFYLKS